MTTPKPTPPPRREARVIGIAVRELNDNDFIDLDPSARACRSAPRNAHG